MSQLHENARKVLRRRKGLDFFIRMEFLGPEFSTWKSQNDQILPVPLSEGRKQRVLSVGRPSVGGHVDGIDDPALKVLHFDETSIAGYGRESIEGRRGGHVESYTRRKWGSTMISSMQEEELDTAT